MQYIQKSLALLLKHRLHAKQPEGIAPQVRLDARAGCRDYGCNFGYGTKIGGGNGFKSALRYAAHTLVGFVGVFGESLNRFCLNNIGMMPSVSKFASGGFLFAFGNGLSVCFLCNLYVNGKGEKRVGQ
ncbi:hypothetical protein [Neisseria benedictiae]|uniref:hypothetical protein n=1 Tax=Neisseria benedictiae TaxID=2830649 RepID=UPI00265A471D|nr:hypothetical protein [Neisseria benedictiae]